MATTKELELPNCASKPVSCGFWDETDKMPEAVTPVPTIRNAGASLLLPFVFWMIATALPKPPERLPFTKKVAPLRLLVALMLTPVLFQESIAALPFRVASAPPVKPHNTGPSGASVVL